MKKFFKCTLSTMLVVLIMLASAPLSGFVGLEFELPEWLTFEVKAASNEYLTSGFCGEVTETTDGTQLSWVLDENGVLTITGEGRMAPEAFNYDLRIKEVVIGEGVENIGAYAFNQCSNIENVIFSETVTDIDNYAFNLCGKYTEIIMSDSIVNIGKHAFSEIRTLKSIDFSDSLKTIGEYAFSYAQFNLTSVEFPDSLEDIDNYAFCYCRNLSSVVFSDSLIEIGSSSFSNCNITGELIIPDSVKVVAPSAFESNVNLTSVYIGSGVEKLGIPSLSLSYTVFSSCSALEEINVSEHNQYYSSSQGVLYNKDKSEVIIVPQAISGEITLPSTVQDFSYTTVKGCKNITVFNVEEGSLYYKSVDGIIYTADGKELIRCPYPKSGSITVAEGTEYIGSYAFDACTKITEVILPDSLVSIYNYAFNGCNGLTKINFPNSLKAINQCAFRYCSSLSSVELPDSVTIIGQYAFDSCRNLTHLKLSESLTNIGASAFSGCNITGVLEIPDNVKIVSGLAFSGNNNLKEVYIGSSVEFLQASSISCSNLSFITVSEDNLHFSSKDGILYNKDATEIILVPPALSGEITIPANVEEFNKSAISDNKNITHIHIENNNRNYKSVDGIVYSSDGKTLLFCPLGREGSISVAENTEIIGSSAFSSCSLITNITLPDTVTLIKNHAFYNCDSLVSVELSQSLHTVEQGAFAESSSLVSVDFPDSVQKIEHNMFTWCDNLQFVRLSESVTRVRDMFSCSGITELSLPESVQSFDDFYHCYDLKTLTINNKYCEYIDTQAPSFSNKCTVRAYCGSPGHELAVKRLLNFESLGHTYLDWYIVSPATYEADGIERRDCAYCDGYDERIVPKLEKEIFTATFIADGKTVATVDFPKGTIKIEEPSVPAKNRYMGEWEEYILSDADITINAVYTLIKSDDASEIETESESIHYTDKDDVLFRFKAMADATVVKSTVSKSVPLDIVLVVDQSGSMDETLGGQTKKVDALKDTAKDFVNTVFENAKMTDADHRISLVGFGLSGNYQGYEKNENTELLTSANGIVKFDNIKTTDYASSLLSVNIDGEVNSALITAIDSIDARGATAADLGFEMAKGVFANTDSTDRQRVVIFMTDGEPTYLSGFQTSVANSAIANASVLKKNFGTSIYSVGVFSDADSRDTNINKFMNAVSSGYPDAVSINSMGSGVDGQYYLTVNNTDSLTSVFKSISTESLSHTAPFDNLTVIKTLSEYVTLTSKQEEQLRIDLIRKYGITNDDIIITKNADGTTTVQINSLTPYEVTDEEDNITYEVAVEFFASLNEKANTAGDYIVDTEDSGVMLGEDAKGYETTFDTSIITLDAEKTRVVFTINGEVYEISENLNNGYAVAPDFEFAEDWQFSGWDTSAKATNGVILDATLTKAERTVTWHTADGDIIQTYVEGDFIKAPIVENNADGDTFLSWDKSIPTTMPDENLEFTAVYGGHVHRYTSEVTKEMTCTADGTRTFTCSCGDTYDEVITAVGHNYEAITPSLEKDDAKCIFCCTNCGDKYDYALDYAVVSSSGKKYNVLYEFQLTDDNLNTEMQPDGEIQIRIPLSELHGNAKKVTVIRTNDDGSKTEVPAVIENGFLVITCDHFTPYEVVFDVDCENHIQGEWVTEKEATCIEEGHKYAFCTECEKRVYEEAVAKLPHTESDWIVDKDATCIAEGSKHKICNVCKATVKTEAIQKLSHSYFETVTVPTCTEEGYTTYTCACGDSYVDNFVERTGHYDDNSDNACDSCGIELKTDDNADNCSCNCHKSGFMNFIWKILCFFYKLFGMNKTCSCGATHY